MKREGKCMDGAKSVMHLRTRLVCSETPFISFEKVRDMFSNFFF